MRKRFALLLPFVLLAMAPPAPAVEIQRCTAKGSETVRSTDKVRVYRKGETLYGCVRKSGVTRRLYRPGPFAGNEYESVDRVRVAGYHVAFVLSSICTVCGDGGPFAAIHEFELRSGQHRSLGRVRKRPAYSGTGVDALVLDRCGRIAYRAVLYAQTSGKSDPELHVWVGYVRRRVDRGAVRSIRLTSDSVRWIRGGERRSAPLEPSC